MQALAGIADALGERLPVGHARILAEREQRVRERAPFFYMEERLKAYEEILDQ